MYPNTRTHVVIRRQGSNCGNFASVKKQFMQPNPLHVCVIQFKCNLFWANLIKDKYEISEGFCLIYTKIKKKKNAKTYIL